MNLTKKYWQRGLNGNEQVSVYASGILAGVLPDVDVLLVPLADHRASITHTPFFWILCSIGLCLLGVATGQGRRLFLNLALAVLVGSLTHIVLDAVFTGIKVLYPVSDEYFRMRPPIQVRYDNLFINYVLNPVFLSEIYTFLAAGIVWRRNRRKEPTSGLLATVRADADLLLAAGLLTVLYVLNWYVIFPLTSH